jgi:hypothetical protein
MSLDKKKIGEEELKRALLMMKYDNRKTLSENVSELIKETNNKETYGAGSRVVVDFNANTLILNDYLEMERADGTFNSELKLNVGTKFVKGSSDSLISKGVSYQLVDDMTGQVLENLTGDVNYYCNRKTFEIYTTSYSINNKIVKIEYFGEDFPYGVQNAFDDLCQNIKQENNKQENIKQYTEVEQGAIACGYVTPDGGPDVVAYEKGDGKEDFKCPKVGAKGCKYCPKKQGESKTGTYRDCTGTYTQGCKSEVIRKVQGCLGLAADGKFGPKTQAALEAKRYTNGFTDNDVDKICNTVLTAPETIKNDYEGWVADEAEGGQTFSSGTTPDDSVER